MSSVYWALPSPIEAWTARKKASLSGAARISAIRSSRSGIVLIVRIGRWVRASTTVAVPSQLLPTNMTSRSRSVGDEEAPEYRAPTSLRAADAVTVTPVAASAVASATAAVRRMAVPPGSRLTGRNATGAGGLRTSRFTRCGLVPADGIRPVHGSIAARRCRYPPRDAVSEHPPPRQGSGPGSGRRALRWTPVTALPSGDLGPEVLVPHWLTGEHREQLAEAVRDALDACLVHPIAAIHLEDVLTELHVAAARDVVWPASAARCDWPRAGTPTCCPSGSARRNSPVSSRCARCPSHCAPLSTTGRPDDRPALGRLRGPVAAAAAHPYRRRRPSRRRRPAAPDRLGAGPPREPRPALGRRVLLLLEEDERRPARRSRRPRRRHDRRRVAPTPDGHRHRAGRVVVRRPVTDAQAARSGVAVLDWADRRQNAIGWRVVVRRGEVALPWLPSATADVPRSGRPRAAAPPTCRSTSAWRARWPSGRTRTVPVLAPASSSRPSGCSAGSPTIGLDTADMHVVVTPHRPVACAGPGIAARLAGETTEASVTLPWSRLADLPWL